MSPPASTLFEVQDIPHAGRGVVAIQRIPAGTLVLRSPGPAAHVVFRPYRKEVCARCFTYDRGRTLPVRDNGIGKVFCSAPCQIEWIRDERDVGLEAWRALHRFVQSHSKTIVDIESVAGLGTKPDRDVIDASWSKAQEDACPSLGVLLDSGLETTSRKKSVGAQRRLGPQSVDPDILGYLLSGILCRHKNNDKWRDEVLCLAMDDQPYKSSQQLQAYCESFVQLTRLLPQSLLSGLTSDVCRTIIDAGNHNAFGIRSGSEDGEEYLGYSVHPSASYFNHSCDPNIAKRRIGRCWEFWAARDVEVGEQCCITYLGGDEKDLTVRERKNRLENVWNFECMCERCK